MPQLSSQPHSGAGPTAPPRSSETGPAHEGEIEIGAAANIGAPKQIGLLHARFVRYPGCQQLMLWLPQSGYHGYGALRILLGNSTLVEQAEVRERLNGSVQMLWDTLGWSPGPYRIEVDHDDGWRHVVSLRKWPAGHTVAPVRAAVQTAPRATQPIVYRDGAGQLLPDQDLQIRARATAMLVGRFSRHLTYDGTFRGGTITYVEGDLRIAFPHEMAGGDCKFTIDLPSLAVWEAWTGTPVARRDEIVRFVAETVQREKASSWRYEIDARSISYY